MDIRISGKNMTVTAGMKEHLEEKLLRLDKYAPRIVESHVILKKEKYFFIAEITVLAKDLRAYGEASSKENMFTAMDQAYSRVEKQLKKFREKRKDHHKKPNAAKDINAAVRGVREEIDRSEDVPKLIRSKGFAAKPMATDEASMQLGISSKPFLVFQNSETGKVNVVFKREDGHHGLVEP